MFLRILTPLLLTTALAAGDLTGGRPVFMPLVDRAREGNTQVIPELRSVLNKATAEDLQRLLALINQDPLPHDAGLAALLLDHGDQVVLVTAIATVGRLGIDAPSTVDRLADLLGHAEPVVRDAALTAVADVKDDRCLPRIIALLDGGEPALARKAHDILRRQTGKNLPAERASWQSWYDTCHADETARFERLRTDLSAKEPMRVVGAVHQLASLTTMRSQSLALLATQAKHPDVTVRTAVSAYLRQLTGTTDLQPLERCLEKIQTQVAVVPPPIAPTLVMASLVPQKPAYVRGLLDTWQGLFALVAILAGGLSATVWFLRTPVGQAMKEATGRFARKTGVSKVVVMVEESTRRLVKPMMKPIKEITKRITRDANRAARKVELATRSIARAARHRAPPSSSADNAALERRI